MDISHQGRKERLDFQGLRVVELMAQKLLIRTIALDGENRYNKRKVENLSEPEKLERSAERR